VPYAASRRIHLWERARFCNNNLEPRCDTSDRVAVEKCNADRTQEVQSVTDLHVQYPEGRRKRLFGRRQGRRLSARQEALLCSALPRHAVSLAEPTLRLEALFARRMSGFALEVGFGGGEHLTSLARARPDWGFVGCESYLTGVAQLLTKIEDAHLDNIRIHQGDAREVIERLPCAALDAVFVLFPDPWPKRRHWKRRFIAPDMLALLARVMRTGAELRVATDSGAYARWTLDMIKRAPLFAWRAHSPRDWRERPKGAPETRYEAKARRAGRMIYYLRFERAP
jgi:tRNA (guanine-N7-)-methyltransferase